MGRKNSGSFVPWWQKGRVKTLCHCGRKQGWETLCHGGRKYGWEPCVMVAERESGDFVSRWQKVRFRALCHGDGK